MRTSTKNRRARRGLSLLEVMVSVAILAMISLLIYGAFDGLARNKRGLAHSNERYHEGRAAMRRLASEISAAYVSLHVPMSSNLMAARTIFSAQSSSPADRLDMTTFSHRRVMANSRESDQNELSYFGSADPAHSGKIDLARREQVIVDYEPQRGGVVQVLAEDIDLFDLKFLDPVSGLWNDSWDTLQATGQFNRLPLQVRVTLVLKGGAGTRPIRLVQKIPLAMQTALNFGIPR